MPNSDLAARILEEIAEHPEHHRQDAWLGGTDRLAPGEPLTCDTTLCVAGHAVHKSGYFLSNEERGTEAFKDGIDALPVATVARRELGLSAEDAEYLFHHCRTRAEVLDALQQLADGADTIDQFAVFDKAGDRSS
jgi:hypothetical protein